MNDFGPRVVVCRGDFNTVRDKIERGEKNSTYRCGEAREFNDFIEAMGLIEVPLVGGRFTWSNKDGSARSRLDRFLLSKQLLDSWKIEGEIIGDKDISDHAPIWLKANTKDWGPKPFRLNNCWFEHKDSKSFMEKEWKALVRNMLRSC